MDPSWFILNPGFCWKNCIQRRDFFNVLISQCAAKQQRTTDLCGAYKPTELALWWVFPMVIVLKVGTFIRGLEESVGPNYGLPPSSSTTALLFVSLQAQSMARSLLLTARHFETFAFRIRLLLAVFKFLFNRFLAFWFTYLGRVCFCVRHCKLKK